MLELIAIIASAFAAAGAAYSVRLVRSLESVTKERDNLERTVLSLVDGEGTMQLALPGHCASIDEANEKLSQLQSKLDESEVEREKISKTLVEVLDADNTVLHQIRIPGEVRKVNKTPCGATCKYAGWRDYKGDRASGLKNGDWHCNMNKGMPVDDARRHFLDNDDQCFHYSKREKYAKD